MYRTIYLSLLKKLVAIFNNLMSTADEAVIVLLEKRSHNIAAKRIRHTAVILSPACDVLLAHTHIHT